MPWRRAWQPTPVSSPGETHGQRSLASKGPQYRRESDQTEATWHAQGTAINGLRPAEGAQPQREADRASAGRPPRCAACGAGLRPSQAGGGPRGGDGSRAGGWQSHERCRVGPSPAGASVPPGLLQRDPPPAQVGCALHRWWGQGRGASGRRPGCGRSGAAADERLGARRGLLRPPGFLAGVTAVATGVDPVSGVPVMFKGVEFAQVTQCQALRKRAAC